MTLTLAALGERALRADERTVLVVVVLAVAGLLHAFAYSGAESAYRIHRVVYRRAADALVLVAVYVAVRLAIGW